MRGIYITPFDMAQKGYKGVANKNEYIRKAFLNHSVLLDKLFISAGTIQKNDDTIYTFDPGAIQLKYMQLYKLYERILTQVDFSAYTFLIIRYPFSTPYFLHFLKSVKKKFPSIQILIDVPTYPYELELSPVLKLVDTFFRKQLKKYVDYCITYCEQDELFGIPCIKIQNGVNISEINVVNKRNQDHKASLTILSVANISFWHGLDRMISGLKNYYHDDSHKMPVKFIIVGDGAAVPELMKMVEKENLSSVVTFTGYLTGEALSNIYEEGDLALGSLAAFRKNVLQDSSFKAREYCARGIPFVLTIKDVDFPETLPFVKYVENNESPIDIQLLVSFYESLINYPVQSEMRAYAEQHLSWEVKVGKIIKYLNK
ncbi:MAG: glycosyltransferase [Chitinophagaceae bacterium]|nr:glycosyltransferase [Chitinophagaceae bacterium]